VRRSDVWKKFRVLVNHLKAEIISLSAELPRRKKPEHEERGKTAIESSESVAFQLLGEKTSRILPLFKDLDTSLQKSKLKVDFKVYVSLTVFVALSTTVAILALVPCLLIFVFNFPFTSAILFGIGASLFTLAFSIAWFYAYPIYRADALKRALEDELPFTTGYMAILTSAGVSPEKIFYSLSNLSVPLAVSREAKDIVRNVSLFGSDIISALEETSKSSPSEKFQEMIEGLISTIHSGGNLSAYLREKSKEYMKLKKISLKKYSDTLSMLSEFYVAILLTGPLFLVIMLTVMAMLGGGGLGMLSPDLLLNLLTYLGIPLAATVFLIILDAASPKW
jgi:flagellar protein FlaJ